MTEFDDRKIFSKRETREHRKGLAWTVAFFVGKHVNLALRDGSVIVNVILEKPLGKLILRYRPFAWSLVQLLPICEVESIQAVPLEVELIQEALCGQQETLQ